ncbi:uncharacterized protein CIMG_07878 [Coccidioides immitis RS]|uniref:Citrate transporter-like domain-containing protein n=1 Tax=Coccidioides immitis (strain RS) TaxID=246410 RepID=J3K4B7_COCIM|nr:uncharacterized protein CIMG_07878 [Coccidioides immitis RS]EAS29132.3 hypothetical protein CIMG_07878 [Coccidioides immitis RS]
MPGLDTSQIKDWRSIVTLIVFIFTNIVVLFPFRIPIYVPRHVSNAVRDTLSALRVIPPKEDRSQNDAENDQDGKAGHFLRLNFPLNFVTAPLIADLLLLAIGAIGRDEVHDGTIGANNISPIDIMIFFITLAYIAMSIDASGLIRYLAFKVLQKGGKAGHRLFFYLYSFFFGLGTFIGNDPIILSGTPFLAYMTRASSNIVHPRAWIYTQFAVANIASAILVSSNPTNLVLAGAFNVKFLKYTANMVVPVVITAAILFPFLLYVVFADESLIPSSIKMHELSEEAKAKKPVNPNIPYTGGKSGKQQNSVVDDEQSNLLSLEEIMNPFLDKGGAAFSAVIMAATLITVLTINTVNQSGGEYPVFWVTLPAAFVMFCWDIAWGWYHRHETREIARRDRQEVEHDGAERTIGEKQEQKQAHPEQDVQKVIAYKSTLEQALSLPSQLQSQTNAGNQSIDANTNKQTTLAVSDNGRRPPYPVFLSRPAQAHITSKDDSYLSASSPRPFKSWNQESITGDSHNIQQPTSAMGSMDEKSELIHLDPSLLPHGLSGMMSNMKADNEKQMHPMQVSCGAALLRESGRPTTLVSLVADAYRWLQETFPTVMAVLAHLPFALVPFSFCMFVLVQALVTKGWVSVSAYGWDRWVDKTGTIGSVGGMGFLSVLLCNFAGTNIGTTILLSRVIQAWQDMHRASGIPISDRTFWATVYSMAIGVNYGAFSTAFSASLAGLLWRDILSRKHIHVRRLDFARVNLPIIAISMVVGCAVLIGEVYITRDKAPYRPL